MIPSLKALCSEVIDEIVAHERTEVESETNALLGLSWDACLLQRNLKSITKPWAPLFHFSKILQSRENGFSRSTRRIYREDINKHWQNMFTTEKGKNKLIAECYESVVKVHNDEPFNPVRTISILEALKKMYITLTKEIILMRSGTILQQVSQLLRQKMQQGYTNCLRVKGSKLDTSFKLHHNHQVQWIVFLKV